jgi:hypothetical protein
MNLKEFLIKEYEMDKKKEKLLVKDTKPMLKATKPHDKVVDKAKKKMKGKC